MTPRRPLATHGIAANQMRTLCGESLRYAGLITEDNADVTCLRCERTMLGYSNAPGGDPDGCGTGTKWGCKRSISAGVPVRLILNARELRGIAGPHVLFHRECAPPEELTQPAFSKGLAAEREANRAVHEHNAAITAAAAL